MTPEPDPTATVYILCPLLQECFFAICLLAELGRVSGSCGGWVWPHAGGKFLVRAVRNGLTHKTACPQPVEVPSGELG